MKFVLLLLLIKQENQWWWVAIDFFARSSLIWSPFCCTGWLYETHTRAFVLYVDFSQAQCSVLKSYVCRVCTCVRSDAVHERSSFLVTGKKKKHLRVFSFRSRKIGHHITNTHCSWRSIIHNTIASSICVYVLLVIRSLRLLASVCDQTLLLLILLCYNCVNTKKRLHWLIDQQHACFLRRFRLSFPRPSSFFHTAAEDFGFHLHSLVFFFIIISFQVVYFFLG